MNKKRKSIAIYADSLLGMGGGSRVILMLAEMLQADIITCEFDERLRFWMPINVKVYSTGSFFRKINIPFFYFFESPLRFYFMKKRNYDINIFMGSSSVYAARKTKNNIWFCFTPNRVMYDLHDWKMKNSNFVNKLFLKLHVFLFKSLDNHIVNENFSDIVSQTETVRKRVLKYYDRQSRVIFSPVDVKKFHFSQYGDFFLTVSRLVSEKRIDLIVRAFLEMPDKKLVIVGDGPEKGKLVQLIGKNKNITIKSGLDDKKLIGLYANCLATLYFPIDEDFGLIPIESMASGKPCFATPEGGCTETIIEGVNGFFVEPDISSIVSKLRSVDKLKIQSMREECIQSSKKFDTKSFKTKWESFLKEKYEFNA